MVALDVLLSEDGGEVRGSGVAVWMRTLTWWGSRWVKRRVGCTVEDIERVFGGDRLSKLEAV